MVLNVDTTKQLTKDRFRVRTMQRTVLETSKEMNIRSLRCEIVGHLVERPGSGGQENLIRGRYC